MSEKQINLNKQLALQFWLLIAATIAATFLSGPPLGSMPLSQWIATGLALALISIVPLLCFIPVVIKPTVRGVSWLGFMLLAYLVWSIMKTFTPGGLLGGLLMCTFNITTFLYTILWLRPYKKAAKAQKQKEQASK